MQTCSIEGCGKPAKSRGWCQMHYMRWYTNGDPGEAQQRKTGNRLLTDEERFWEWVSRGAAHECWRWTRALRPNGYGRLAIGRSSVPAHRFAYELLVGPVPDGLELDHTCRNPACVNPAHLEPVTHAENMRRAKGMRKTHCPQEHSRVTSSGGQSYCPTCRNEYRRRKRAERT